MWSKLLSYGQQLFWWGSSRGYPKNVEGTALQNVYKATNHLLSKKFTITLIALAIMVSLFFSSTVFLFFLPSDIALNSFVVLFSKTVEVISIIIAVMVGGESMIGLRYNSGSSVAIQNISQQLDQNINENRNLTEDKNIKIEGAQKTMMFDEEIDHEY